jgi:hypothetical protein
VTQGTFDTPHSMNLFLPSFFIPEIRLLKTLNSITRKINGLNLVFLMKDGCILGQVGSDDG